MANSVEKAVVYESFLDSVVQAGLTSGDLMQNPHNIKFTGGSSVEIATVSTSGMTSYDRNNGYTRGAGNLTWKSYTIPYDRGFEFLVDVMDEDESGGMFSAGNVLKEFGDNQEIPELDTVRYSDIFQAIVGDTDVRYGYYTPIAATLITQFNSDVAGIRKVVGRTPVLKAKMSESAFAVLTNSTELYKQLTVQSVAGENGVTTEIYKLNNVMIMPVPDDRLITEIGLVTAGDGGFAAKSWAQDMNWLIYSTDAVTAFEKHKKTKVFANGTHPNGDGDLIQGRLVHGCWVLENKKDMIYISLKTADITGFDTGIITSTGATNATYTLGSDYTNKDTGHEFYFLDGGSATELADIACYAEIDLTGWTKIAAATAVTDVTVTKYYNYLIEVDENELVIRRDVIQTA